MKTLLPRWWILRILCTSIFARLPTLAGRISSVGVGLTSIYIAAAVSLQPAHASDVIGRIKQRGHVIVGIAYVGPIYAAGQKFRTPENVDGEVAEALAKRLNVSVSTVRVTPRNRLQLLQSGKVDGWLLRLSDAEIARVRLTAKVVTTGYQAQPKLIMRSDTDIKQWSHLKGRSVCVSEGSPYLGILQTRYGAREKVVKAPADALLALRVGTCDATVHDDAMLDEMLKLPEWKKFSASLPLDGPGTSLVWVSRSEDDGLRNAVSGLLREWNVNGNWAATRKKWVNAVAFEVYLDQNVPDCH
ncbi:transporter substrate-binding domain-containing protein [Glaciimonas sp. PCH181]|uniref:transporter substrate-binding domain-containing protein n=1 Tax=Glaciimonas sp. PCH181 TaxID=2133943 RepID=UPI000D3512EF|nr:transporter substrate-binding domain-containing protein [Glaciimonas sp. PCH181]PUA20313.1 ABC transporter substrate-binding protein [Glaciimonas sp. PCH181]